MRAKTSLLILLFSLFIQSACDNGPGEGGTSTIRGKVLVREYNRDFSIQRGEDHPAQKEDVYLIYGDDDVYSDNYETNYNGIYEFNYLREGKYVVFVYSKDSTFNYDTTSLNKVIFREVEITEKNQTIEVPDMVILNN